MEMREKMRKGRKIAKHYKACTKYFPVLLCTTKLAQSTSQYYFVLHSLHKVVPSTTLYYKACTKHFPILLCTTKLAQSRSQYYFVLQSLHKARSSFTFYYKACTKSRKSRDSTQQNERCFAASLIDTALQLPP